MKHIKKFEEIQNNEAPRFIIGYGLGGGFGGIHNYEVVEATDLEDAETQAYDKACEEYQQYDGMYGLRDLDAIMEEDDVDEEEAEEVWNEEREGWLDYVAYPYSDEKAEELSGYHFENPYEK